MGPTWGPSGADRSQVGPMLAPWTLRQNGRHFVDDIFKSIFLHENIWIPIKISLKFLSMGSINNIPALVQKMAWRRPDDKPLSEPIMVSLPTHICFTRPQWVKYEKFYITTKRSVTLYIQILVHSAGGGQSYGRYSTNPCAVTSPSDGR